MVETLLQQAGRGEIDADTFAAEVYSLLRPFGRYAVLAALVGQLPGNSKTEQDLLLSFLGKLRDRHAVRYLQSVVQRTGLPPAVRNALWSVLGSEENLGTAVEVGEPDAEPGRSGTELPVPNPVTLPDLVDSENQPPLALCLEYRRLKHRHVCPGSQRAAR